jgi:hypothetical protein
MNTMKTLALAGVTALSLGMGAAMAQSDGTSMPVPDSTTYPSYGYPTQTNGMQRAPSVIVSPQSGSSDVEPMRAMQPRPGYDYGDIASPG